MTSVQLNRKLTLEGVVEVADGAGGRSHTWSVLGILWAQVKPGRGQLQAGGEATLSVVPAEIVVRGAPIGSAARPKAEQRFREGARSWRILAVTELDAYGRYLRCDTVEETAA